MKTFPVLNTAITIPYGLIEIHQSQAVKNHYQTIDRLAERGGLDWVELYYVLNDKPYDNTCTVIIDSARQWVIQEVDKFNSTLMNEAIEADILGLRRCIVRYPSNEKNISKNAYFHRWCERSDIIDPSPMIGGGTGGIIKYVTALVEYEDGSMDECSPKCVIFTDRH